MLAHLRIDNLCAQTKETLPSTLFHRVRASCVFDRLNPGASLVAHVRREVLLIRWWQRKSAGIKRDVQCADSAQSAVLPRKTRHTKALATAHTSPFLATLPRAAATVERRRPKSGLSTVRALQPMKTHDRLAQKNKDSPPLPPTMKKTRRAMRAPPVRGRPEARQPQRPTALNPARKKTTGEERRAQRKTTRYPVAETQGQDTEASPAETADRLEAGSTTSSRASAPRKPTAGAEVPAAPSPSSGDTTDADGGECVPAQRSSS